MTSIMVFAAVIVVLVILCSDVSLAWLVWSRAAESALADAFQFSVVLFLVEV